MPLEEINAVRGTGFGRTTSMEISKSHLSDTQPDEQLLWKFTTSLSPAGQKRSKFKSLASQITPLMVFAEFRYSRVRKKKRVKVRIALSSPTAQT